MKFLTHHVLLFRDGEEDADCEDTAPYVLRTQEIKDSSNTASVKINIEGMRCQSCVKNIEGTIGGRPGVVKIKVALEEKIAYVEYKTEEITANQLVEAIEDMGFTASLCDDENSSLQPSISSCSIHVDGMTCMSCVKSITGMVSL